MFCELEPCRGTSFIGAAKLSPVTNLVGEYWSSVAVQGISEPAIYHGARVRLRADARVRVQ